MRYASSRPVVSTIKPPAHLNTQVGFGLGLQIVLGILTFEITSQLARIVSRLP